MVRTRILAVLLATLAPVTLSAAPVPAGGKTADVTDLPVAANAMAVVQLNGLERTKERVAKMLEGVGADVAKGAVKQIDDVLKSVLEGRDLSGVDGQGRAFVAVGPFADLGAADGPMAFALPVKDYKTFREKFLTASEQKSFQKGKGGVDEVELEQGGEPLYLVDNGAGYVIVSANKDTAESYAGKYEKLTAKTLGTLAEPFLAADLGVFVNVERVNAEYGAQIAQGRALFPQLLQLAAGQLEKGQIEVLKAVVEGLFQVVEDAKGVVIAVEARPDGVGVRVEGAFTADSLSDKVLAAETPTPLKALADLPKGMTSYTASKWGKGLSGIQRKFATEFGSDDEDAGKAIDKLIDLLAEADGESVSFTGADFAALSATTYKDPGKVADARLAVFKALDGGAKYSNLVLKAAPKTTKEAQKHAGFTLHSATVEVDFEASVKAAADEAQKEVAIAAMKKLMPEKQTLWFGSDGKRFVQVTAKDWDAAKKLLDEFTSPKAKAGDDPQFALTRKQLPADAGYLMLTDAVGLLSMLSEYAGTLGGAIPGAEADLPKFGKVKSDPAYIGVAVVAKKGTARFDLFVPVAAVKATVKAIEEGAKEKKD